MEERTVACARRRPEPCMLRVLADSLSGGVVQGPSPRLSVINRQKDVE